MKREILIAIGITILFLGTYITPSVAIDNVKKSTTPISNGNTLYVGGTGEGNYSKIQDAVDDASDGDTVFVYNGTYYENIVINKPINLIGENRNNTIIHGIHRSKSVVYLTSNIFVSGFTITNGSDGICLCHYGNDNIIQGNKIIFNWFGVNLGYEAKNNTISNNLILHNSESGVRDDTHYDQNIVTWNVIGGNGRVPYYYNNAGLFKHRCGGIFHHNDFVNNAGPNVDTDASANGQWDDGSEGNFWDDWESNPGYPDKYLISSWCIDQYDYHPKATSYFNYTIVIFERLYYEENPGENIFFWTNINRAPSNVSWFWEFGDGNTSNESYPSHSYSESGIYDINVTVTDKKGQSDMDKIIAYIGFRPDKPVIKGPTKGRPYCEYEYFFISNDSDSEYITYYIDWDDGFREEIGPVLSGDWIKISHTWEYIYNYTITVKTIDETFRESPESIFGVQIPRTRPSSFLWYEWLLERFPLLHRLRSLLLL